MSTSLTPITNANTFGQWKEKTNDIITALGNTVTLGDAETNDSNIVLTGTGDITSQGTLYINTIDATAANSANIITINADAKLNGELQINNTYASEINYYQAGILTWTAGTNSTHTQFDIKKGSVVLRLDDTAGAITGTGLTIDDSLLPDLITSNIDGNVTGQLLATDTERSHGAYGSHDTAKIGHVWSIGTAYQIPNDGTTFGSLYGMASYHVDNTTALTSPTYDAGQKLMAGSQQIVFTSNGTPGVSIGLGGNIWAKGNIYENETLLSTTYLNRVLGGTITGAISTNKAITLTGTGANGTVTAAKFAGPLTGAVTGNVTGNVTGAVTGNASTATKLATSRTIDITGDITATAVSFDGSSDISISASVDDNSHSHTSANISDATSANTGSTIVERNISGGFSAGTISATLSGNASTATRWANTRTLAFEEYPLALVADQRWTDQKTDFLLWIGTSNEYRIPPDILTLMNQPSAASGSFSVNGDDDVSSILAVHKWSTARTISYQEWPQSVLDLNEWASWSNQLNSTDPYANSIPPNILASRGEVTGTVTIDGGGNVDTQLKLVDRLKSGEFVEWGRGYDENAVEVWNNSGQIYYQYPANQDYYHGEIIGTTIHDDVGAPQTVLKLSPTFGISGITVHGDLSCKRDITAWTSNSDIRLKENIVKIDKALDKVNQISGYTFNYIGNDESVTGVIAQEIEKVLPQVVYDVENDDGKSTKAVRYGNIVGLLIEAIKELKAEVDELKKSK